jgi:hypothetical protein
MWMDVLRRGADPDEVQKKTSEFGRDSAKFRKMLDTWHQLAAENRLDELHRALEPYAQPLRLGGEILHTAEIDLFGVSVNASVYLIKADILFRLVQKINSDNAQGEYYLTDLLRLCRRHYPESNVLQVVQKSPGEVMAFNNPQELLEIERHVQGRAEEIRKPSGVGPAPLSNGNAPSRPLAARPWPRLFPKFTGNPPAGLSRPLFSKSFARTTAAKVTS